MADADKQLMAEAIAFEAEAQRAVLAGDRDASSVGFRAAARRYRDSWELAGPTSYGRLVGMLKAAVLAGGAHDEAAYVRAALDGRDPDSPIASYAQAVAALVLGDDEGAARWARHMRAGSPAFVRTAAAVAAISERDEPASRSALEAIVADFAARDVHLTGVAFADTALMLARLAEQRGLRITIASPAAGVATTG